MDNRDNGSILFDLIKEHKWVEFVEYITSERNYDVNIRDDNNNYLIQYALLFNKKDIAKLLIDYGAKLDIMDSDGRGILFIPIKFGYDDLLALLLQNDKINVGVSLVNIQDKSKHTALHYAILFNNETAVRLLLKKFANVSIQDKYGYAAIHLAIIQKNMGIINILLENKLNINLRCKTGETPLHMACNFELYDIVNKLLKLKAEVNVTDYDNELTPLLYAITLYRLDIVKLLIQYKADPNHADQYGNTAYHYCVYENKYDIFDYIFNNASQTHNMNLTNIESKTICHLVFENNNISEAERIRYLNKIIKHTNVNIQDNYGNTCLIYLVKFDLWQTYMNELMCKKLDIYVYNKDGENCRSLIQKNLKENEKFSQTEFFNFIVDSFYCYITVSQATNKQKFEINWQNECNKEDVCKRKIRKYILDSQISIPNFNKYNIEISQGDLIKFGTFTGILLDVITGLLYLIKKYKFVKSILTEDFIDNQLLSDHYTNVGIVNMNEHEFLNFEILWINNKIYVPTNFESSINKYINDSKKNTKIRFLIMPLGIEIKDDSHANYLIYDNKSNELERFEPHGSRNPNKFNYNSMLLDSTLKQYFQEYFPSLKYIKPEDFLPKVGYQLLDNSESNKYRNIGDPGGFCALWCIWYTDMRLTYPDIPRNKLVETSLNLIRYKGISFRTLIRNYSNKITNLRDEILSSAGLDINNWLNDNYTEEQSNKVIDVIKKHIRNAA
jgi:ankyrin repeat protein